YKKIIYLIIILINLNTYFIMKLKVKEVLYPKILSWLALLAHLSRRITLFVEISAVTPPGVIGTGNCMKKIKKKNPALLVIVVNILFLLRDVVLIIRVDFIR